MPLKPAPPKAEPPRAIAAIPLVAGIVACIVGSAAVAQPPSPIVADCDRSCLEAVIGRYLAAVVAHDPTRLPLSAEVKYTENEQLLDVGDGYWQTATGMGNYQHYFADPTTSQAAWMGR
jgi:hypothetical protein